MAALSHLMPALVGLSDGNSSSGDFSLVTITHCRMGDEAHGIAPGSARLWASLRTSKDIGMEELISKAEALVNDAGMQV